MSIPTKKRFLITIVAEALIETRLVDALKGLGVRGYSISACRGDSLGSVRASEWSGNNVQIQTIVSADLSDTILQMLARDFIGTFSVVAFRSEVEVLRPEKFS
jgi:hypothetical protein